MEKKNLELINTLLQKYYEARRIINQLGCCDSCCTKAIPSDDSRRCFDGDVDGDWIKEFRNFKNLTQEDLAEILQLHPGTLSRYERNIRPIPEYIKSQLLELN